MEHLYQAAGANADLLTDPAHGDAVQVVHNHPVVINWFPYRLLGSTPGAREGKSFLHWGQYFLGSGRRDGGL